MIATIKITAENTGYQTHLFPGRTVVMLSVKNTRLKMLKPMYTKIVARRGTIAPRLPNCARDCTICGNPIRGPWLAWKAMKKVPTITPSVLASTDAQTDRPIAGPRKPSTRVESTKLPENQNGPWCQALP